MQDNRNARAAAAAARGAKLALASLVGISLLCTLIGFAAAVAAIFTDFKMQVVHTLFLLFGAGLGTIHGLFVQFDRRLTAIEQGPSDSTSA
jgi:hypothetical protein